MSAITEHFVPLIAPMMVPAFFLIMSTLDRLGTRKEGLTAGTHYVTTTKQQQPAKKVTPSPQPQQHYLTVKR